MYFGHSSGVLNGEENGLEVGVRTAAIQEDAVPFLPHHTLCHADPTNRLQAKLEIVKLTNARLVTSWRL